MTGKKTTERENRDLILASELIKGLEATTTLIENLLDDIRDSAELVGGLKNEVENLRKSLEEVQEIVQGGPDNTSLLTRLALLEKDVSHLAEELDKHETKDLTVSKERAKSKIERLKIWATIIVGLIGALATILVAVHFK